MRSTAPRPPMFSSMRPSSQLPRMTSNQRVGKLLHSCFLTAFLPRPMLWKYRHGYQSTNTGQFNGGLYVDSLPPVAATQALGPRTTTTAASVAANPVRGVSQYKYATGVRNTQQHVTALQQVTMQQVEP